MIDHLLNQIRREIRDISRQTAAGVVATVSVNNNDGTFDLLTSDGQTYSRVTATTLTQWPVGAATTLEYASADYQIVASGAYGVGGIPLTPDGATGTSGPGTSQFTTS